MRRHLPVFNRRAVNPSAEVFKYFDKKGKEHAPVLDDDGNPKLAGVLDLSKNEKIGDAAATYAGFTTCPDACCFHPDRQGGCYAASGNVAMYGVAGYIDSQSAALQKAHGLSQEQIEIKMAEYEAAWIRRIADKKSQKGRPIRVHVKGDCNRDETARIIGSAVEYYMQKTGGMSWSYTHAHRHVARESWGKLSVLASIENPADGVEALRRGYMPCIVIPQGVVERYVQMARSGAWPFRQLGADGKEHPNERGARNPERVTSIILGRIEYNLCPSQINSGLFTCAGSKARTGTVQIKEKKSERARPPKMEHGIAKARLLRLEKSLAQAKTPAERATITARIIKTKQTAQFFAERNVPEARYRGIKGADEEAFFTPYQAPSGKWYKRTANPDTSACLICMQTESFLRRGPTNPEYADGKGLLLVTHGDTQMANRALMVCRTGKLVGSQRLNKYVKPVQWKLIKDIKKEWVQTGKKTRPMNKAEIHRYALNLAGGGPIYAFDDSKALGVDFSKLLPKDGGKVYRHGLEEGERASS